MKQYEEDFCISVINDPYVREDVFTEIFSNLMNNEYGFGYRYTTTKLAFIKSVIDHDNIEHIDRLIDIIDGDVANLLEFFNADYDDLDSIVNTRDKWENSTYSDEIEGRIEELSEVEDD